MNTTSASKTDFIKFNVSPDFKTIAEKKAKEYGMTLSELGRMLFGSIITGIAHPKSEFSEKFLALAEDAKRNYNDGKGKTFDDVEEAIKFLHLQ